MLLFTALSFKVVKMLAKMKRN